MLGSFRRQDPGGEGRVQLCKNQDCFDAQQWGSDGSNTLKIDINCLDQFLLGEGQQIWSMQGLFYFKQQETSLGRVQYLNPRRFSFWLDERAVLLWGGRRATNKIILIVDLNAEKQRSKIAFSLQTLSQALWKNIETPLKMWSCWKINQRKLAVVSEIDPLPRNQANLNGKIPSLLLQQLRVEELSFQCFFRGARTSQLLDNHSL